MRRYLKFLFIVQFLFLLSTISIIGQNQNGQDAVWARATSETITLDGKLNEASWAKADSINLTYGMSSGLPTSGWNTDGYTSPTGYFDTTRATVKFLSQGNHLYIAFIVPDSSIGGHNWPGPAWWDGLLMNCRNIRTIPFKPTEIFPTFLFTDTSTSYTGGRGPGAGPRYGYNGKYRDELTAADTAVWNMNYTIQGTSNDDSSPDTGYVFEMKINLDSLGYNATQMDGDIIGLSFQIYDCDWYFTGIPVKRAVGRTWWQHPWGNNNGENSGRVYIRPDVTIDSGPAPEVPPDVIVPNGIGETDPVIDGDLSDPVWKGAYTFQINFGDTANIRSYPGIGKNESAWYETDPKPDVLDPVKSTVKMFFKDHYLYMSANVADGLIQGGATNQDKKDGVRFILGLRDSTNGDHAMVFLKLLADFDSTGNAKADEDLDSLVSKGEASLAMTVDGTVNDNSDIDNGYTVEIKVDLTALGYPMDLGDHLLFGGACVLDYDVFDDPAQNYGTRTWFFKENDGGDPTAWMFMDPNTLTDVNDASNKIIPANMVLHGNYPNPFNPSTTISYSITKEGEVNLLVYNVLGQLVSTINLYHQTSGTHIYRFNAGSLASGVYFYRLTLNSSNNKQNLMSKTAKMILLK